MEFSKNSIPRNTSGDHKLALAKGRAESRIIGQYLALIDAQRPRRGRQRSLESITRRLKAIEHEMPKSSSVRRIHLIQERINLNSELASHYSSKKEQAQLEKQFVKVLKSFSERHHISPQAWSEFGVSQRVLQNAGLLTKHTSRSKV